MADNACVDNACVDNARAANLRRVQAALAQLEKPVHSLAARDEIIKNKSRFGALKNGLCAHCSRTLCYE